MEPKDEAMKLLSNMFGKLLEETAPKWRQFPGGISWRYFGRLELRSGVKAFCWSTKRNANGNFLSWVYQPRVGKKRWDFTRKREHRLMKDAKARALKLYYKEKDVLDRALAAMRKAQRKKNRKGRSK